MRLSLRLVQGWLAWGLIVSYHRNPCSSPMRGRLWPENDTIIGVLCVPWQIPAHETPSSSDVTTVSACKDESDPLMPFCKFAHFGPHPCPPVATTHYNSCKFQHMGASLFSGRRSINRKFCKFHYTNHKLLSK